MSVPHVLAEHSYREQAHSYIDYVMTERLAETALKITCRCGAIFNGERGAATLYKLDLEPH